MTEHSITDWVLAVSTVFLTVFTGLLFFFTYRLWLQLRYRRLKSSLGVMPPKQPLDLCRLNYLGASEQVFECLRREPSAPVAAETGPDQQ